MVRGTKDRSDEKPFSILLGAVLQCLLESTPALIRGPDQSVTLIFTQNNFYNYNCILFMNKELWYG
jgi:hypothetical protein